VGTCEHLPAKGQRIHESVTDHSAIEPCSVGARGVTIGDKLTTTVTVDKIPQDVVILALSPVQGP